MKKILLFLILITAFGYVNLKAQCTVSNVKVKLNSSMPSGSNCVINFDLSFNLEHNDGNKYIWFHLWRTASYPNLDYSKPPTKNELVGTLSNIGINNNVTPAQFQTSYPGSGSPNPPIQTTGTLTVLAGSGSTPDLFTITGVQVTVPGGCTNIVSITGDVWSSQAESQSKPHCSQKGIVFTANDPTPTGLLFCNLPRQYSATIGTLSAISLSGTYSVYRDNGDGAFNSATDFLLPSATNVAWGAVSGTPYQSGQKSYAGNNAAPTANRSLWIEVSTTGLASKTYAFIPNGCSLLPVSFKSFTALRNHSNVSLKWETATEQNSKGFAIERNISGTWEQVAFVPSQAPGGNSNSSLIYQYNDLNNVNGISQYRVRQVDFDAGSKFSDIRAVRGEGQIGKTIVYPNPSFNGRVSVVFEDAAATRDASLSDMSGKILKQWKGVKNNNIQIDNLAPGMYSLKIIVSETGEQSVEKIIVSKH